MDVIREIGVLNLVVIALVLISDIWVGVDSNANRIPLSEGGKYSVFSSILWVLGCLLFWIAAFPFYLSTRSKVLKSRSKSLEFSSPYARSSQSSGTDNRVISCPACGCQLYVRDLAIGHNVCHSCNRAFELRR